MATKAWTIQALGAAMEAQDEKINQMWKSLVIGNGHEPLTQTILRNTEWINTVKRFLWIAITAMLGIFITGLVSLAYMVYRIYPLLQQIEKLEPFAKLMVK